MGVTVNFNGGEYSPLLLFRNDLEKYASGAQKMVNFEVLPQGGMRNRAGTEFIDEYDPAHKIRLIPFVYNMQQRYVLEFGDGNVRIRNAETLEICQTVTVPYRSSELAEVRHVQSGDVLFIVHPSYPPSKISRYGETDWRYGELAVTGGPFQDENSDEEVKIGVEKVGDVLTSTMTEFLCEQGDHVTLLGPAGFFDVPAGGMKFQLTHPNKTSILNHVFQSNTFPNGNPTTTVSPTLEVKGKWTVKTSGGWHGVLKMLRSFDGGRSWNDYRAWASEQDRNVESEGEEERENALYKFTMNDWGEPDSGVTYKCSVVLTVEKYWINGIIHLESNSADGTRGYGTVEEVPGSAEATADWAEGSWNTRDGFPRNVCFFQDRLVFSRTEKQPQTFWFSHTGDYLNFAAGTDADEAMVFTLQTNQLNAVEWMIPRDRGIIIGTQEAEGILSAQNEDEPLSPDNRKFEMKTAYGSGKVPAILVQDNIVFIQRGGEHFREFTYEYTKDGYVSPDLSILAEHILRGGVAEMCFKALPFPALYFVRNDGELVGFTYERMQNVTAWYRFETDGKYESAAVIPGTDGDELWVAVRRGDKGCIERFTDRSESCYLDSAGFSSEGLWHLEGKTVNAVLDGKTLEGLVVTNGRVEVPQHNEIVVGLPYESEWEGMPLEYSGSDGNTIGQMKKIVKVTLFYRESLGGEAGCSSGEYEELDERSVNDRLDHAPELQTGDYEVVVGSRYVKREYIRIRQRKPKPLLVLAMQNG